MIPTITNYSEITVIQVLMIIIPVIICDESPIDYDLPLIDDSNNYELYHFRPYTRYDQFKLDPNKFFQSIYSHSYRVLPKPYATDYKSYKKELTITENLIYLEDIRESYDDSRTEESSGDFNHEKYLTEDLKFIIQTHEKYKQSSIIYAEYMAATHYLNKMEKMVGGDVIPRPISPDEFMEVMVFYELLPKKYENGKDFFKARTELGRILINSLEDLNIIRATSIKLKLKDHQYDTELVELSVKDVHLRKEKFSQYSLRMLYLGKVPFHPVLCNELYGTDHAVGVDFQYLNLKLDLTEKKFKQESSQNENLNETQNKDLEEPQNKTQNETLNEDQDETQNKTENSS